MPRFHTDKTLEHAERIMLVSTHFADSHTGSSETRERAFQAACTEAAELVRATGGELVCQHTVKREKAHPALLVGTGKAEELAQLVRQNNIELVVFNHELSPTQERNLERALQCRVLDRVGLILAIFAQRAQSQEGRLQVELAQLTHLAGRLVRGYGHLQSQKGGIGLKGPGETQLETDRRLIQTKITALRRQLAQVKKQRETRRKARQSGRMKTFAIVGYTNAGKSTLFNRLTKADVLAKDQLFATLDTTVRKVVIQNLPFLLADTVGFIRKLPTDLVDSFKSTLDEVREADLLLHVVDISHPDFEEQINVVNQTLKELECADKPSIIIFNKIDNYRWVDKEPDDLTPETKENITLDELKKTWMARLDDNCLFISAREKENIDEFRDVLYRKIRELHVQKYPYNDFLYPVDD